MQNVAKLYHLKMVFDENLTITVGFQRNDYFKNVITSLFQLISYNNLAIKKQI